MKTFHIIEVRYIGVTNTKPARYRIHSERFKQTVYISTHKWESGAEWLRANGFNTIGAGWTKNSVIVVSDTFKPLKPVKS